MSETKSIDGMNEKVPYCCFIPCDVEATFEIVHGITSDDFTYSCDSHLLKMLTDAKVHTLIQLAS